jgi:hypothetical protein
VLAQPYSPWKENIYLVENDRRALERDIRRTKNRMEGDLKAVLEQSRRGRGEHGDSDPVQLSLPPEAALRALLRVTSELASNPLLSPHPTLTETRQTMLEKEQTLETNVAALAERIEDDQVSSHVYPTLPRKLGRQLLRFTHCTYPPESLDPLSSTTC